MFCFTGQRALFLLGSLSLLCVSEPNFAAQTAKKIQPQKIASTFALANLLKKHKTNRFGGFYVAYSNTGVVAMADGAAEKSTSVSHTDTNIQVTGVDESDRAKVDDNGYIYQLVNNQVIITKAFPVEQLSQSAIIVLPEGNFSPTGLYLQDGKLVVVGNTWQELSPPVEFKNTTSPTAKMAYGGWWGYMRNTQTRTIIYDVSDQTKPKQIRDVVVDGDYLDSRRIGNYLYFITRSYPRYYMMPSLVSTNPWFMKTKDILPSISDSKAGKTSTKTMALKDVVYFPDFVEPDYVVVASIDLEQPQKEVVTKAYLGAGDLVYASHENLYLSASKYNFGGNGDDVVPKNITTTPIFKIGIDAGKMNFVAA
ncbi:MAG: beta-propeller domain-containing protein, partial [Methylococcaceae bacterium]